MRGPAWVYDYFPRDWFSSDRVDFTEKLLEVPSMALVWTVRILWLAYRIAQQDKWLLYDDQLHRFRAAPRATKKKGCGLTGMDQCDSIDDGFL